MRISIHPSKIQLSLRKYCLCAVYLECSVHGRWGETRSVCREPDPCRQSRVVVENAQLRPLLAQVHSEPQETKRSRHKIYRSARNIRSCKCFKWQWNLHILCTKCPEWPKVGYNDYWSTLEYELFLHKILKWFIRNEVELYYFKNNLYNLK